MHMRPKKYLQCPNVWVEDACKETWFQLEVGCWGYGRGGPTKHPINLVVYYVFQFPNKINDGC